MKDIEKLIRENRQELDLYDLPTGHERRFQNRLSGAEQSTSWRRSMISGIAVSILALVAFNFFDATETAEPSAGHPSLETEVVPEKIKEVEQFYTIQVNRSMERIESIATSDYSRKALLEQLEHLETSSQKLQQELGQHPNDARILSRLIENYKLRLQLTERHLMLIETQNEVKTTTHDKS